VQGRVRTFEEEDTQATAKALSPKTAAVLFWLPPRTIVILSTFANNSKNVQFLFFHHCPGAIYLVLIFLHVQSLSRSQNIYFS